MAIIKAKQIWSSQSGLNPAVSPIVESFECGGQTPRVGYIQPIGDCCNDSTLYTFIESSVPAHATNPSIIYGVAIQDSNGNMVMLDVLGANETGTADTDATDLAGKLDKVILGCGCLDCTASSITPIVGVYLGVYPSISSSVVCFTVARTDAGLEGDIEKIGRDYYNDITKAVEFVSRAAGVTTYKLSFNSSTFGRIPTDTFAGVAC